MKTTAGNLPPLPTDFLALERKARLVSERRGLRGPVAEEKKSESLDSVLFYLPEPVSGARFSEGGDVKQQSTERVQNFHAGFQKIAHVSCDNRQAVSFGDSGDLNIRRIKVEWPATGNRVSSPLFILHPAQRDGSPMKITGMPPGYLTR